MQFSQQQTDALKTFERWWGQRGEYGQVFKLFGYAGTGKSTIANEIAKMVGGNVLFGAYTGKAASVLERKGCANAMTIHSMIYQVAEKSKHKLRTLQESYAELSNEDEDVSSGRMATIQRQIDAEQTRLKQPSFMVNANAPAREASLIILDECSMIDERVGKDILSFDVPVLVLGDPAQLPPVRGKGYFTQDEPDVLLTEIHRQALDNPIIELATKVRNGERLEYGTYGESSVIKKALPEQALAAGQILCGKNSTRSFLNNRMRELLGHATPYFPEAGEKILCLKNNNDNGLMNGTLWTVCGVRIPHSTMSTPPDLAGLKITDGRQNVYCDAWLHHFQGREKELDSWSMRDHDCFDYGYAITTHKAQGSQWDDVLVYDQSAVFRGTARNWLYTAITRAAEKVTIVRI